MNPAPTDLFIGEWLIPEGANLNETSTGEVTFLALRHKARSFEPEPVAVTVVDIAIIVDERKGKPITSDRRDADVDDQIDLYGNP